jgi:hypothetical protein
MFDEAGKLRENQLTFDWKSAPFREDQLGGHNPDMSEGTIDEVEIKNIAEMLQVFGNTLQVLEASNGVFRFKVSFQNSFSNSSNPNITHPHF